jgi:hypothetical protein
LQRLDPTEQLGKEPMVEELEQEFAVLKDKVHDLREYL